MKKYVLILLLIWCTALSACSGDGTQQLETAQFEELQGNKVHALQLYEEVISKYPASANARIAQERLDALKGSN